MADSKLKQKVRATLKKALFHDPTDRITVSDGVNGNIHVRIVSHKFDGLGLKEENDLIWNVLMENLKPKEWGMVSLTIGASPEEIKAI